MKYTYQLPSLERLRARLEPIISKDIIDRLNLSKLEKLYAYPVHVHACVCAAVYEYTQTGIDETARMDLQLQIPSIIKALLMESPRAISELQNLGILPVE